MKILWPFLIENSKESTKQLLKLINELSKIAEYKIDVKNLENKLLFLSQRTGVPLIAGTDTHALNEVYADGRRMLQKAKNVFFEDEENWDLVFKTYDELIDAYEKQNALPKEVYIEAIQNTNRMAEQIEEFQLDYTPKYPKLYNDSEKVFQQKSMHCL